MSKARLVITAIEIEGRSVADVVAAYAVSRSWVYELLARYRLEGDAAFEPRSRRPHTSPTALDQAAIDAIVRLRKQLVESGLDAGPETIAWHLRHHHQLIVSVSTIARTLTRQSLVTPEPRKRPKTSYLRFEAAMPNETWQSDFTHYPLTLGPGITRDTEIITWLDDHARYALHVSAHHRVTGRIVLDTFREAAGQHGYPASVLTDIQSGWATNPGPLVDGRGGSEVVRHLPANVA
jgi:transposase InsO family protein